MPTPHCLSTRTHRSNVFAPNANAWRMARCALATSLLALAAGCAGAGSRIETTQVVVQSGGSDQRSPTTVQVQQQWIGGAVGQSVVSVGASVETHVGLWIDVPQAVQVQQRAPMDLAVVIDVSGSMATEGRIDHAKLAASSLLESLREGDIVSITAFASQVYQVAPPTLLTNASRAQLMQLISGLRPLDSTNLYGGLSVGETHAMNAPATHGLRRVIVISDGMANVGPSSPDQLGLLAAGGTDYGVQVSAIGVGLQYDEHTLGALAVRSAGRLYHLENPSQMAAILQGELERLNQTQATDAYVILQPAPGVELLGVETARFERLENGALKVPLGSLFGGQHRELLVRARVQAAQAGTVSLARTELVYRDLAHNAERRQRLPLNVQASVDIAAVSAPSAQDQRVVAMVASNAASQSQLRAVEMLNQGQAAQAAQEFERAEAQLQRAESVASAAPASVRANLRAQQAGVRRSRERAVDAVAHPARSRAAALGSNADAFSSMGY
ncbi:MAG: VWA domain-containing protein [Deltaproteobacteria bacterium]|nr:VWA domain-containing protein [Deltaproteobacteria bacterium]